MSNDVVVFDEEKIGIIKEMFCKNATKAEFELFIHMAKRLQLDPICKQIYFIKFGQKMSIVVGIDGYRAIAERTGTYMPGREPSFNYDKDGKIFSCTAYVKKFGPDKQWHEVAASAILSEYDTNQNQWAKGKHYMLAKTAEALALRKGWPSQLAGTHTEDEMDKAIIDVESSKTRQPTMAIIDLISEEDTAKIEAMLGDDEDYRKRILNFYKVKSFRDVHAEELTTILERVAIHNQERLKTEMETVDA